MSKENFNLLVERAMAIEGYIHMRPVVEKELLHYDILFALGICVSFNNKAQL